MYYLETEQTFDSAHFLKDYDGKCKNIHGHTWKVKVQVAADELTGDGAKRGMVIDFSDLKNALKSLCDVLDHCLIYESKSLKQTTVDALVDEGFRLVEVPFRPTAENFAKFFFSRLKLKNLPIKKVEVYETAKNCASYEE